MKHNNSNGSEKIRHSVSTGYKNISKSLDNKSTLTTFVQQIFKIMSHLSDQVLLR